MSTSETTDFFCNKPMSVTLRHDLLPEAKTYQFTDMMQLLEYLGPFLKETERLEMTNTVELKEHDITTEKWREYDFGGRVYRIENPVKLFLRAGGTTHRVLDSKGIVHCCPAVGVDGCALRWENRDPNRPVNF